MEEQSPSKPGFVKSMSSTSLASQPKKSSGSWTAFSATPTGADIDQRRCFLRQVREKATERRERRESNSSSAKRATSDDASSPSIGNASSTEEKSHTRAASTSDDIARECERRDRQHSILNKSISMSVLPRWTSSGTLSSSCTTSPFKPVMGGAAGDTPSGRTSPSLSVARVAVNERRTSRTPSPELATADLDHATKPPNDTSARGVVTEIQGGKPSVTAKAKAPGESVKVEKEKSSLASRVTRLPKAPCRPIAKDARSAPRNESYRTAYDPFIATRLLSGWRLQRVYTTEPSETLLQPAGEVAAERLQEQNVDHLREVLERCTETLKRTHVQQKKRKRRLVMSGVIDPDEIIQDPRPDLNQEIVRGTRLRKRRAVISMVLSGDKGQPCEAGIQRLQLLSQIKQAAVVATASRTISSEQKEAEAERRKKLFEKAAALALSRAPSPAQTRPDVISSEEEGAESSTVAKSDESVEEERGEDEQEATKQLRHYFQPLWRMCVSTVDACLETDDATHQKSCGDDVILYNNGDEYHGGVKESQRFGVGEYKFQEKWGVICGDFQNDGVVSCEWKLEDGRTYKAQRLSGNTLSGSVDVVLQDGSTFTGTVRNGIPHGKGTWSNNVASFSSVFDKGVPGSRAEILYSNGLKFEGEVKNGEPVRGILSAASLGVYTGDLDGTTPHGEGEWVHKNGSRYIGSFRRGKMHGSGEYHGADGSLYKGEYCDDEKHGKGLQSFANGDSYEGEFYHDKMEGVGRFVSKEKGLTIHGKFRDGKFISRIREKKPGS